MGTDETQMKKLARILVARILGMQSKPNHIGTVRKNLRRLNLKICVSSVIKLSKPA
jgi:hypothetical protein